MRSWDGFRHTLSRRRPGTNLIIHHGVANIVSQAGQCLRIPDVVEETRDFSALCQWFQVSEGLFQFPRNRGSGPHLNFDKSGLLYELLPSLHLIDLALRSRSAE